MEVLGVLVVLAVVLDPAPFHFLQLLDRLEIASPLVHDHAVAVAHGDDLPAELMDLLQGVDRHVPRSGDEGPLPLEPVLLPLQHLLDEVGAAVPGRLGAHLAAAPDQPLPGENARLELARQALVLPEQVPDLAAAHPDVARGDVRVLADDPPQLRHEALAEPHHLVVRLPLRVEVRPPLGAADRHPRQGVLEDLLESEELDDPEVDRGVEPEPPLVRPEGAVELHPEAAVDLDLQVVVLPGYPEDRLPL